MVFDLGASDFDTVVKIYNKGHGLVTGNNVATKNMEVKGLELDATYILVINGYREHNEYAGGNYDVKVTCPTAPGKEGYNVGL